MKPRLPEHWSKVLLKQPETGMTYQIVDVTLRDGRIVRDVAIIQSQLVGDLCLTDRVAATENVSSCVRMKS